MSMPLIGIAFLLMLGLSACADESVPAELATSEPAEASDVSATGLSVADTVDGIGGNGDQIAGRSIEIVAYVNDVASRNGDPTTPPPGCPVFLEHMPTLTDVPFAGEFEVAGVMLPAPLPDEIASLQLVVPLDLGMIDIPSRGHLRGRVLHPDYAGCPEPERLFVLEEVIGAVPERFNSGTNEFEGELTGAGWQPWGDPALGLGLDYPDGWQVEESRNVGSVLDARFISPDGTRSTRLTVLGAETYWSPAAGSPAPTPLIGERHLLVSAGSAPARLVDVPAVGAEESPVRELRVVMNYDGQTLILTTRFSQSEPPDLALINVFSQMVSSMRFDLEIAFSDPLDPMVTARAELGSGPFIDQSTAEQAALTSSGMIERSVVGARLVPELAAREASSGSCRDFQERPEGVWLVTIEGVIPTGQQAERVVYIDAVTARSLCQTEGMGSATVDEHPAQP